MRSKGYALIDQEVELGLRSIAIPIKNARGVTIAAVNIGVPTARASIEELVPVFLKPMLSVQAELRSVLH